jgi:hypothetical protein
METTIPLFPCGSLDETLAFYHALGFEVTYKLKEPYPYRTVRLGGVTYFSLGVIKKV